MVLYWLATVAEICLFLSITDDFLDHKICLQNVSDSIQFGYKIPYQDAYSIYLHAILLTLKVI